MVAPKTPICFVCTDSEFFSDGTALELARAEGTADLRLLTYSNGSTRLLPTIEYEGTTYAPVAVDGPLARRLILPAGIVLEPSTRDVVTLIKSSVQSTGLVDESNATIAAYFAITSAVADLLPTAPVLAITGTISTASQFLQVLGRCCRHSIFLAEISARVLSAVSVDSVHPTLLALQVASDAATARWLSGSSHSGFLTICGAKLRNSFCAKALYLDGEMDQPPGSIRVNLLPVLPRASIPERELAAIAAEVQPRLLGYRLAFRAELLRGGIPLPAGPTSDASRPWVSALYKEAAQAELAELLRDQVDDAVTDRAMSPVGMLIECALAVAHEGKPNVKVAELAELLNVALAARGEQEVKPRAVGAMLKSVGLNTKRLDQRGRGLVLSEEVCRRIHRLARDFHIPAAVTRDLRCALCPEFWGGPHRQPTRAH